MSHFFILHAYVNGYAAPRCVHAPRRIKQSRRPDPALFKLDQIQERFRGLSTQQKGNCFEELVKATSCLSRSTRPS